MIDNHLYIPTTRLHKEKHKRKGSEYRIYPFNDVSSANILAVSNIVYIYQK